MFVGTYSCSVDDKGRINFPAKLREDLGPKYFITIGLDSKHVAVYSEGEYENFVGSLKELHGSTALAVRRMVTANTFCVAPDKQGRILLPQVLREFAGIEKEVAVIGALDHCEIWADVHWEGFGANMGQDTIISLFDKLGL